jgi:hypothetical protein
MLVCQTTDSQVSSSTIVFVKRFQGFKQSTTTSRTRVAGRPDRGWPAAAGGGPAARLRSRQLGKSPSLFEIPKMENTATQGDHRAGIAQMLRLRDRCHFRSRLQTLGDDITMMKFS